jgi:hypothetical protein
MMVIKNNKKELLIILGVLILVGGGILIVQVNKKPAPNIPSSQQQSSEQKIPDFVMGKVTKIDGLKVYFVVGTEEKSVLVNVDTKIIKQVKEAGVYKNIDSRFADIKKDLQIVVYYQAINGSEYTADKIQILPF